MDRLGLRNHIDLLLPGRAHHIFYNMEKRVLLLTHRYGHCLIPARVEEPAFTQNTDSYFPAKALPNPSSRKLLDRTITGLVPK